MENEFSINLLSIEELKSKLKDRNITVLARETGLNYVTIWNILKNNNKNIKYRLSTIEVLSNYFRDNK